MQNPFIRTQQDNGRYVRYLLIFAGILLIAWFIPKHSRFKYDFELNRPWEHDDLLAPMSFAVQKSDTELAREQKDVRANFKPFYQRLDNVKAQQQDKFIAAFNNSIPEDAHISHDKRKYMIARGLDMLDDIFARGIIEPDSITRRRSGEFIISEIHNSTATDKELESYLKPDEARSQALTRAEADTALNRSWFTAPLRDAITYNIVYDSTLTNKRLQDELNNISATRGMISEGEKIISRGNIVTPERYQALVSLRAEYETHKGHNYLPFLGYLVIIACLFILYAIHLELFNSEIASRTRSLVLILINILLFTGFTAYVVAHQSMNIYVVPYCIVPIVLLAFFGVRAALLTHLLVVLLCGLMVPNSYEFVLLQTVAGFTAILSMARIRYISQFFISALLIFMTYCLVYLGFNLVKNNSIGDVAWTDFMWFGGNFILTLLAYPLIYVNEKIFGFLSDISLLELADINNKILKELFLRAPGTFQHSLQVANLAEAVIDRVGGNALLTRVGALYHDIGKMENPDFFIENQKFNYNPHENLSDVESAEMIISHVTKGVEIAQENHLPRKVIDFIRSHHGTTRVEYFYKHYLQDHQNEEVDESIFRYPGPKPSSKETAIVMIVDSVEAASRSMKNPDEKQIDNLIDRIIDTKMQDNQFDYATITIQEINTCRRILKKLVKSIYHIRIEYPVEPEEKKVF
jgi:hypothetical protein